METLPLIDMLVLDEADRIIEVGHFKEVKDIVEFIYKQRPILMKKNSEEGPTKDKSLHKSILEEHKKTQKSQKKNIRMKTLESKEGVDINFDDIEDLGGEDAILEDLDIDDLQIEELDQEEEEEE